MKNIRVNAFALVAGLWTVAAAGQIITNDYSLTLNQAVPDASWSGLASSTIASGIGGIVTNVSVTLNLSGGFNGDLYAYLVHDTGFAVLLNRVGLSSSNSFGYADPGLASVVFRDTAASDIHFYGGNGGVALPGLFQPDGRTLNPGTSPPGNYDAATRGAMLSSFLGTSSDGTWTLFVADLSGGGQSTLVSWSLDVVSIPEPATWTLLLLGGLLTLRVRLKTIRCRVRSTGRWMGYEPE